VPAEAPPNGLHEADGGILMDDSMAQGPSEYKSFKND
jgi:hypothetical protein